MKLINFVCDICGREYEELRDDNERYPAPHCCGIPMREWNVPTHRNDLRDGGKSRGK